MLVNVYGSFILGHPKQEATKMSCNRSADKQTVIICIMEYYSALKKIKSELLSYTRTWRSLKGILL